MPPEKQYLEQTLWKIIDLISIDPEVLINSNIISSTNIN